MSTLNFVFPPPPPPPPVAAQQGSFLPPQPDKQGQRPSGFDNPRNRGGYGQGRGRGTWSSRGSVGGRGRGARALNGYPGSSGSHGSGRGGYVGQGQYLPAGTDPLSSHSLQGSPGSHGGIANGSIMSAGYTERDNGYQNPTWLYSSSTTPTRPTPQATKQNFHHSAQPRTTAPPCVPAYGTPLPSITSGAADKAPEPLKKKRKYNQLGLTPKTEDHESSEEDIDEEAKLAAAIGSATGLAGNQLQFTYKGQQATLKSPSDIAAWIEERKKRYPTMKRAEEAAERKKKQQEADRIARESKWQSNQKTKVKTDTESPHPDKASKAKSKAEKLRKRYEKAQRRVSELEAKVNRADHSATAKDERPLDSRQILRHEEDKNHVADMPLAHPSSPIVPAGPSSMAEQREQTASVSEPITHVSEMLHASLENAPPWHEAFETGVDISALFNETDSLDKSDASSSTTSSSSLSDSTETSSSGSSSEDDAPVESSSKPRDLGQVPEQKFSKPRAVCRVFLSKGYCFRGNSCQYRHELPERGSRALQETKGMKKPSARHGNESKREHPSLYQRMLAQQNGKDDELVLKHIIFLGENGLLDGLSS